MVNALTVKSLRENGYQVTVRHNRVYTEDGQLSARGGSTVVDLISPTGKMLHGEALCSVKDGYNKRYGVKLAIERAFMDSFVRKGRKKNEV